MSKNKMIQNVRRRLNRIHILSDDREKMSGIHDLKKSIDEQIENQSKAFQAHLAKTLINNGVKMNYFADTFLKNSYPRLIPDLIDTLNQCDDFKVNEIADLAIELTESDVLIETFMELMNCEDFKINDYAEKAMKKCSSPVELYFLVSIMERDSEFDKNKFHDIAEEITSDGRRKKLKRSKQTDTKKIITCSY
ncbi:MAG: hypothetical protein OIF36_03370 [Alphaproteobacteria bacterium]|nr:hypothetical protein [Alphaproteobacteria bacterium]